MNTKEKLELLWKYLFLVVVAIGIFQFTHRPHLAPKHFGHDDKILTSSCCNNKSLHIWNKFEI